MSKSRMIPLATVAFLTGACVSTALQSSTIRKSHADAADSLPTVRALEDAPKAQAPNGRGVIYHLAQGKNAFIGKLHMDPGGGVPEHRDATEEYIHILVGGGTMYIEDVSYEVRAGMTIYMPAHAKVRFENGDGPLEALQVFSGPEPAAKYDSWTKL